MIGRLARSTFGMVAIVAIGFAVATLAIGVVAHIVTHEALEKQLDHRIAVESDALVHEARSRGVRALASAVRLRDSARTSSSLDYLLADAAGRPIAGSIVTSPHPRPGKEELLRFRRDGRLAVGQALTTTVSGGRLTVVADRSDLDEIDRTLETLFACALGATLALGTGAAAVIGWTTRRRLAGIDATARAIIAGDLSKRIPRDGSYSEFDRLAGTLNQMLERIGALMENLRQVSSDVAHDLRTPLTRLCNHLDVAADGADDLRRMEAIGEARVQAGEVLEIFASVLRVAEVESLTARDRFATFDVAEVLVEMAETYEPEFDASGHHLRTDVAAGLMVRGDWRLIAQAVSNLLENALRHTPRGTTAVLATASDAESVAISLTDDGPGASIEDAERLFQRFVRAETSRSRPGHGLGLALVRAIAVGHGGEAFIENGHEGFSVTIRLPRA